MAAAVVSDVNNLTALTSTVVHENKYPEYVPRPAGIVKAALVTVHDDGFPLQLSIHGAQILVLADPALVASQHLLPGSHCESISQPLA